MAVDLSAPRLTTLDPEQQRLMMDVSLVLAHRLRGLVASIEGFTDLLTDTLGSREQRELALRILEGTSRIERILSDLQLFSQPLDPVRIPLRPADLLNGLLAMFDEAVQARVQMEVSDGAVGRLSGDPQLLRQLLLILVQNALDATEKTETVRLRVTPAEATEHLNFDIWNAGHIELEEAETLVFVPFFTTKAQNLGVGLSIAQHIAEAHGGTLTLHANDAEEGTCFRLSLPLHPSA